MKAFFKILKYGFKLSPLYLFSLFINDIVTALNPFVALFYSGKILDYLLSNTSVDIIMKEVYIFLAITLGLNIIKNISEIFINWQIRLVDQHLYLALINKCLSLNYTQLENKDIKEMLTKADGGANGSGGFGSFFYFGTSAILVSLLSLVFASLLFTVGFDSIVSDNESKLFLFLNSPYSFLVIFGLILVILVISLSQMKKINKISYNFYLDNVDSNQKIMYILDTTADYRLAKDVRIYSLQNTFNPLYKEFVEEQTPKFRSLSINTGKLSTGIFVETALLLFASYLYIGAKAYFGIISVGSIVTTVGAISFFAQKLIDALTGFSQVSLQSKYLINYFNFIELKDSTQTKNEEALIKKENTIEFNHVFFKYPNTNEYALNDVSFKINPKKKLAIVGKNGAGKSTIIKLIGRLYYPESGEILFNGTNINNFTFDSYQKVIAILFQDFNLFGFTLKENVSSKEDHIAEEKVKHCLDLTAFDYNNKTKLSQGINTYLFHDLEDGEELSGGEQQKVAIARGLYKDSPIILLDEPTSALDPVSELNVYKSIEKLVNDKTSVFISHRMSSTRFCDEIIVLDKGKIVQRGTHVSLMKEAKGIYYQMFSAQAKYYQ